MNQLTCRFSVAAVLLGAPFVQAVEKELPPHSSVGQRFVTADVDWSHPVYGTTFEKDDAIALSVQCLNAAENPSASTASKKCTAMAPGDASTPSFLDNKIERRVKRAHHLGEKEANREFLNSPQGIAFKQQIASTDDEINAVYEKYLNVFREGPERGKELCAERDRQVQLLKQKRDKIDADFEKLKHISQVYRAMLEKHLQSELKQVKGKTKSKPPEEDNDNQ